MYNNPEHCFIWHTGNPGPGTLQKPENRDPSGTLQKPENRDPSRTLQKPKNRDPSETLRKPKNRNPSGTLKKPGIIYNSISFKICQVNMKYKYFQKLEI